MELWKTIRETDGRYEISSLGRVRRTAHILKPYVAGGKQYFQVSLGAYKRRYIHRLVAEYFLGGTPNGFVVNHKDGNRLNNQFDNLEVITPRENVAHAIQVLRRHGGAPRKLSQETD